MNHWSDNATSRFHFDMATSHNVLVLVPLAHEALLIACRRVRHVPFSIIYVTELIKRSCIIEFSSATKDLCSYS